MKDEWVERDVDWDPDMISSNRSASQSRSFFLFTVLIRKWLSTLLESVVWHQLSHFKYWGEKKHKYMNNLRAVLTVVRALSVWRKHQLTSTRNIYRRRTHFCHLKQTSHIFVSQRTSVFHRLYAATGQWLLVQWPAYHCCSMDSLQFRKFSYKKIKSKYLKPKLTKVTR